MERTDPGTGSTEAMPVVTRETVTAVVSGWVGVALAQVGRDADDRLADLEARLSERIVGQPEGARQVAARVRLARAGLTDPDRPAAVLLLAGPRGVGKTALAVALAEALADGPGGEPALVHLAMSEYGERRRIAGLFEATDGAGRAQEGRLASALRGTPRAVVLLDEIDRAHAEVLDALLPLLATGRWTDTRGRQVDARQAIFVLTATMTMTGSRHRALGFEVPAAEPPSGLDALSSDLRSALGPDLLRCVDEVVLLRPLGEGAVLEISRRRVVALRERVLDHYSVDMLVSDDALALLARHAASGPDGAREVDRVVTRLLAEPLSRALHAGAIQRGTRLLAVPDGDGIVFEPADA
jgi:ATP-dependent Clp protease ATP-binding subunit ClpA